MKTLINSIFLATLLFAFACNTPRQEEDSKDIAEETNDELIENRETERSADLVVDLVSLNYDELELAQLASEKATSPEVKNVASELIKEHNSMIRDLTAMAATKGFSIPTEASKECRDKIAELQQEEQGDKFDEKVLDQLESAHRKTVDKLEKLADAEDPDLQTWASSNVNKVQAHLDVLKTTEEDVTRNARARENSDMDREGAIRDEVPN